MVIGILKIASLTVFVPMFHLKMFKIAINRVNNNITMIMATTP